MVEYREAVYIIQSVLLIIKENLVGWLGNYNNKTPYRQCGSENKWNFYRKPLIKKASKWQTWWQDKP